MTSPDPSEHRAKTAPAPHGVDSPPLLEFRRFNLQLQLGRGLVRVVDDVCLTINTGETVCLVGESGCGKTVTALSIARLLPLRPPQQTSGAIRIDGSDVLKMSARELQKVRGRVVSYVFQEPATSLNPVMRVGDQILESLRLHRPTLATDAEVIRLLREVGITAPELRRNDYPHQLSGGMQQRVMIAMALAPQPKLLVADEPTTALDVTIQAQIMTLLKELKSRAHIGILLITHNLNLVSEIADSIAVMYAGQIVEQGPAGQVLEDPVHPYTRALLDSVPVPGAARPRLKTIPGTVPSPEDYSAGCRFYPRCPSARRECLETAPPLENVPPNRLVRCLYWRDLSRATPTCTGVE